ncbi:MAG: phosphate ABC transporter ATP-binding protein, partial [Vicinamibacterales bacterium]
MSTAPLRVQVPVTRPPQPEPAVEATGKIDVTALDFYYGPRRVLEQISVLIRPNEVTALIGPSGCGKS